MQGEDCHQCLLVFLPSELSQGLKKRGVQLSHPVSRGRMGNRQEIELSKASLTAGLF